MVDFFHPRTGRVVKRGQQLGRAAAAKGGVTTRTSNASSLMSCPGGSLSFDPKEKDIFEAQNFQGTYYQKSTASLVVDVFYVFGLLCVI
jgi:hypothetical protein